MSDISSGDLVSSGGAKLPEQSQITRTPVEVPDFNTVRDAWAYVRANISRSPDTQTFCSYVADNYTHIGGSLVDHNLNAPYKDMPQAMKDIINRLAVYVQAFEDTTRQDPSDESWWCEIDYARMVVPQLKAEWRLDPYWWAKYSKDEIRAIYDQWYSENYDAEGNYVPADA